VDENAGAPVAPVRTSVSFGPWGFDVSGLDFPAEGLGCFSTIGDLLLGG
jgi:hypothetical protein